MRSWAWAWVMEAGISRADLQREGPWNSHRGAALGAVPTGVPCDAQGKLRESGGELAQLGKNDIWMKVGLLHGK